MKRSKLEDYLAIITVLVVHGPLQAEKVKAFSGITEEDITADLSFLVKQRILLEKRTSLLTYSASPRGIRLVNFFGNIPKARIE